MRALICRETDKRRGWHSDRLCRSNKLTAGCRHFEAGRRTGDRSEGGPRGLYFQVSEPIEPLLVSLFEPTKGMILVTQSGINQRKEESRHKTMLRSGVKL